MQGGSGGDRRLASGAAGDSTARQDAAGTAAEAEAAHVRHWLQFYRQLLAAEDAVLAVMPPEGEPRRERAASADATALRAERARRLRRLEHWKQRALRAGLDPDELQREAAVLPASIVSFGSVTVGHLRFDVHAHDVWVEGRRRRLTPNEWRLLNFLVSRRGEVVSRREAGLGAWGPAYIDRPGEVELYISRLRKKIAHPAGWGPPLIETVRGHGYRLAAGQPAAGD